MGVPHVSPPSPLSSSHLPSLTDDEHNGVSWAEAIEESLRLPHLPLPPRHVSSRGSQAMLLFNKTVERTKHTSAETMSIDQPSSQDTADDSSDASARPEIRIQQPTSVASPRPSADRRHTLSENAQPSQYNAEMAQEYEQKNEEKNPRHSVHLYSMRISHHLRSGSLLSWEQLADAPELPSLMRPHYDCTVSDQSRMSHLNRQSARHERQTSSSGFASSKMPHSWGKILSKDQDERGDMAFSIYSSRPQSPPDSFVTSLTSLGRTAHEELSGASIHSPRTRRSNSFPTDNDNTPLAKPRHEPLNLRAVEGVAATSALLATPTSLARKNSVADTKKSKFREELSPSPPRKRITPSESIMKFLNPKRLSGRSQSEASLKREFPIPTGDATHDMLDVPTNRERRESQSMMSLQKEQKSLTKEMGTDHMWDQALKAHQQEKASMFLPKNRNLAAHASPFRDRSGSSMTCRSSNKDRAPITPLILEGPNISDSLFAPSFTSSFAPHNPVHNKLSRPHLVARRSSMATTNEDTDDRDVSVIFEKQGDSPETVGVWGRYPSHTRDERTKSAGKADRVESRDFALEAAVKFASAQNIDEDMIDPAERIPSMPLMPGEKKRKKKVGSGKMAKGSSMTFGKQFLKNYSKNFRSSSAEFRKHGRNHRSSITTGGVLEFPELEVLPELWRQGSSVDGNIDGGHQWETSAARRRASDNQHAEKPHTHDSMATLRPRPNSSAPNLSELTSDGMNEDKPAENNARVWSMYYDDCVLSYPRASMDLDTSPKNSGPARFLFESRHPSMHSRTMPPRFAGHSRHASHVSRLSVVSRGSTRPSLGSDGVDGEFTEKRSMVGVRRSTMDLISKFKEQEIIERERVLSMTRAGSRYDSEALAAL